MSINAKFHLDNGEVINKDFVVKYQKGEQSWEWMSICYLV